MPLPVLLLNSTTGADTNSGAGPSTPITGTGASTSADGLTVTLPNADLTAVVVDGSHAILVNSRILMITAKGNSGTPTAFVTVANSAGASLTGLTYSIGGKRQTFYATASVYNVSLLPGWTVFLESGYNENITSTTITFTCNGSATSNGYIYLLGAGRDVVTLRHNASSFVTNVSFGERWFISGITFINSTDTGGSYINAFTINDQSVFQNCRINGAYPYQSSNAMLNARNSVVYGNIIYPTFGNFSTTAFGINAFGDSYIYANFVKGLPYGVRAGTGSTGSPYVANSAVGPIVVGNKILLNTSTSGVAILGYGESSFYWYGRINNNIINVTSPNSTGISLNRDMKATRFFCTNNCIVGAATGITVGATDLTKHTIYRNNFWNVTTQISPTTFLLSGENTVLNPNLTITAEDIVVGNTDVLNILNHFPAPTGGGGGTFNPLQHPLIR